jgi:hypothetical protein
MKRVMDILEEQNSMRLMIVPKNEKTRDFLERLNAKPKEAEAKLVYYKMRDGKIVDQIWRAQQ